jgi:endonuclease-3
LRFFNVFIYNRAMKKVQKNMAAILEILSGRYPVVKTQLAHASPFQLLIATILSAQCTDRQVNRVTQQLFKHYPDPQSLASAPLSSIKKLIFSTGFYNNKAKNIKACAQHVQDRFSGRVPADIDQLVTLPGVGRKTANVVLSVSFGYPTIVVDTHVYRVSRRLGLTRKTDPTGVEFDLMKIVPKACWNDLSLQLIYFGREICDARKPKCMDCPLYDLCPAKGKKKTVKV